MGPIAFFAAKKGTEVAGHTAETVRTHSERAQTIDAIAANGDPTGHHETKKVRAAAGVAAIALIVGGGLKSCDNIVNTIRDVPGIATDAIGNVPRSFGEGVGDGLVAAGEGIGNFVDEVAPPSAVIDSLALVESVTFPTDEQPLVRGDLRVVTGGTKSRSGIGFLTGYTVTATGEGSQLLKLLNGKDALKTTVIIDRDYTDEDGLPAQDAHLRTEVDTTGLRATLEDYVPVIDYEEKSGSRVWSVLDDDDPKRNAAVGYNIGFAATCKNVLSLFLPDAVEKVVDARMLASDSLDTPEKLERMQELTAEDMDVVFVDADGREIESLSGITVPNTIDDDRVQTKEQFASVLGVEVEDLFGSSFSDDDNYCSMSQEALEDTVNTIRPSASPSTVPNPLNTPYGSPR